MSDDTTPAVQGPADFMARYQAHEQRAADLHPANKAGLFAALAEAGVTKVTVRFDGFGDSGQIEDVAAVAGEKAATLPRTKVEIRRLYFGADEPELLIQPLAEAIETLAYAFLEHTHGGRLYTLQTTGFDPCLRYGEIGL
jgi:hypothetical protein